MDLKKCREAKEAFELVSELVADALHRLTDETYEEGTDEHDIAEEGLNALGAVREFFEELEAELKVMPFKKQQGRKNAKENDSIVVLNVWQLLRSLKKVDRRLPIVVSTDQNDYAYVPKNRAAFGRTADGEPVFVLCGPRDCLEGKKD